MNKENREKGIDAIGTAGILVTVGFILFCVADDLAAKLPPDALFRAVLAGALTFVCVIAAALAIRYVWRRY